MVECGEWKDEGGGVGVCASYCAIVSRNGTAELTMSLFVRLFLVLRGDHQARLAYGGTVQPVAKEQQQSRVGPEEYWETLVGRFNYDSVAPHKNM